MLSMIESVSHSGPGDEGLELVFPAISLDHVRLSLHLGYPLLSWSQLLSLCL